MPLDPFRADVARIALAAAEGRDFALAGGNREIAHGLVSRVTEDVDLFTTAPAAPARARHGHHLRNFAGVGVATFAAEAQSRPPSAGGSLSETPTRGKAWASLYDEPAQERRCPRG